MSDWCKATINNRGGHTLRSEVYLLHLKGFFVGNRLKIEGHQADLFSFFHIVLLMEPISIFSIFAIIWPKNVYFIYETVVHIFFEGNHNKIFESPLWSCILFLPTKLFSCLDSKSSLNSSLSHDLSANPH